MNCGIRSVLRSIESFSCEPALPALLPQAASAAAAAQLPKQLLPGAFGTGEERKYVSSADFASSARKELFASPFHPLLRTSPGLLWWEVMRLKEK